MEQKSRGPTGIKGGGGKRDLRDEGVSEKDTTLRKEAVM
jgi:hypothetical protein